MAKLNVLSEEVANLYLVAEQFNMASSVNTADFSMIDDRAATTIV